jgi:hypothetical protein
MTRRGISAQLRREVERRSRGRCAYCQTQQSVAGSRFTVDHIIPKLLGGTDDLSNLCLACWECNLTKQGRISGPDATTVERVPLFRPDNDAWSDHFQWAEAGQVIVGTTASGRATVALLRLNRPALVRARERWIAAGWHPPAD